MKFKKSTDFNLINRFLTDNYSSPTHWPEWNNVVSKYYYSDFYYLCALENDKLIGICPIHKFRKTSSLNIKRSGQVYSIPYGGWIFNKSTLYDFKSTPLKFNEVLTGFTLPVIREFNVNYPDMGCNLFCTLLVDLKQPYEQIFNKSFEHRVRKAIRKATNNNVSLLINNDIELFYQYYYESCEKRGLQYQSKDFFNDLFLLTKNIQFEILWAAIDKEYIGYLVIVYDKNISIGFLSYMFPKAQKLGQGDFLISEAIKRSQLKGCDYFDLCYIEKERLPSIYDFKKGFSKVEIPIVYFEIKPLTFRIMNKLT